MKLANMCIWLAYVISAILIGFGPGFIYLQKSNVHVTRAHLERVSPFVIK
jgi:hypothetical protein